ncbi:ABC transporter permease [Vagococcus silagei]|uniref:ABC transporter permease n=1 Tax=Vagococcus silagei TaxID=2508885 RepID=A0A4S3B316_9ENTE|nr:ABC transporter permease [Vagococcus silagei]THB60818.1 ABC transporter permease [Vagococcus silagei]
MNKLWVVALETYKKHVKTVTFLIMLLAPFVMVAFSLGFGYFANNMSKTNEIAVISENEAIKEGILAQGKKDFKFDKKINSEKEAEKALKDEKIDGFLVVKQEGDQISGRYTSKKSLGTDDQQRFTQYLNGLQLAANTEALKLKPEEVQTLMKSAKVTDRQVEFKDNKMVDNNTNKFVLSMVGFLIVFVMYMIVLNYASITAQEVASEKGTRIMEVILSSTSAAKHYYGKIIGISLVILTQVAVYAVTGVVGYVFAKDTDMVQDMLKNIPLGELLKGLLGYNLLFLLFGVLLYTILSAFMGSLVTRSEDAPKAVTPVTFLVLIAAMPVMMLSLSQPDHVLIKITSYIPFFSSFSMPVRIANDSVQQWEILASLGLLALSCVILLKVSAAIYKSTVLIYSDKSMGQVFKEAVNLK